MSEIVLAGGCFWGLERLLMDLNGVESTVVGYAGGARESANYDTVKMGESNHAEAVKLVYNESALSLKSLLIYFFKIHDPTTLNQQGNDVGTQYRSTIFVKSIEEESIATEVIKEINDKKVYKSPIVTTIERDVEFFEAEEYHQKYLVKHPEGYNCHFLRTW